MATIEQKEARKREREQRIARICNDYLENLEQTKFAPHCIFETLAEKYSKLNAKLGVRYWPETIPGIRNIIIKAGLYTAK